MNKALTSEDMEDTRLDIAQLDTITAFASAVDRCRMTLVICTWTADNESRPRVIRGIALRADLLIRRSEEDRGLNHVLRVGTGSERSRNWKTGGPSSGVQLQCWLVLRGYTMYCPLDVTEPD